MQYPTKQMSRVLSDRTSVTRWLRERHEEVDKAVREVPWPAENKRVGLFAGGVIGTMVSFFALLVAFPNTEADLYQWPSWGWISAVIAVAGLGLGSILTILVSPAGKQLEEAKRRELMADLKTNPLCQRATLIDRAMEEYERQWTRYEEWFARVDDGIESADETASAIYWNFLVRANAGLSGAIENFWRAVKTDRRNKKYLEKHPEERERIETESLSLLLEELNVPVELPPEHVFNPTGVLQAEEDILEILHELDTPTSNGERRLARQIESLGKPLGEGSSE